MRGPLIAFGAVVVIVVVGAIAYVAGIGPLTPPTAARSMVFVAISRSSDETDAHEIEAIDLTAGTRDLFDAGGRITAMAVAPDRRSLYVGLDGGKVVFLDATTGIDFGDVDLHGPAIVSLVPTVDGRTLFAVAVTNIQSSIVPIDLATRKTGDPITFTMTAGAAVIRGDALIVPLGDPQRLQLAFIDINTRAVTSRLTLPRGSLVTATAFRISDGLVGVMAFDAAGPGGLGMRMYAVSDPLHWRDVQLAVPLPQGPRGPFGASLQAVTSTNGTIHACAAQGPVARRYVVSTALKSTSAGTDCGPLAGGDQILMAKRDPAQLLVLDEITGKTVRTLPLAGVPARLVH